MKFTSFRILVLALVISFGHAQEADRPFQSAEPEEERIFPTSEQAANISRSQILFMETSQAGSVIQIPATAGVNVRALLSGSISIRGVLTSDIESRTEIIARNVTKRVINYLLTERSSMKEEFPGSYFSFFQVAANFGYSAGPSTERVINTGGFRYFNRRVSRLLKSVEPRRLQGTFSVNVNVESDGVPRTIFARISTNRLTLRSGEVINFVNDIPLIAIVDQTGAVLELEPEFASTFEWTTLP